MLGLLTVVTYVLAGLAKLRYGGFGWLAGDVLRNQIAADALQKSLLGATYSPLVGWVTSHGWVLVPAAVVAVVVELAAPVAFVHGRPRDVVGGQRLAPPRRHRRGDGHRLPVPACAVSPSPRSTTSNGRWR